MLSAMNTKYILPVFLVFFILFSQLANARCIDIFYLPTCPHCEDALSFFYNISSSYNLTLHEYNVENPDVTPLFYNLSNYYNSGGGVPLIIIGNKAFLGFAYGNATFQQANSKLSIGYSAQLLSALENLTNNSCPVLPFNSSAKYTVITPTEAKSLQGKSKIINALIYILLFIMILVAIYIAIAIKRAKRVKK